MTQEDKFEQAKELYKTANEDQKYVLEKLFPELQESEDENIRKALIKYFSEGSEYLCLIPYNGEECIDWLEKQEMKETIWSEEDIDMIDWLIRCCEKEHEELCNDRYGHQEIVSDLKRDCRKKWDWLESLKHKTISQSQWKPSDEQMEVLLSEVTAWEKGCPKQKVLESLYNDLKNLKRK